jgi:phage gp29-like protein
MAAADLEARMDEMDTTPIPGVRPDDVSAMPAAIRRQGSAPLFEDDAPIGMPSANEKTPITVEIASIRRNLFIPPRWELPLEPQDPTLRSRGGGWDYQIYEQAESDPEIHSTLQKRKGALGAYPTEIIPASDKPIDIAAADLVKRAQKSLNFSLMVKNLLDAINKGFGVVELMWELVDGEGGKEWHAVEALPRDQRRFRFDLFRQLRLIDWNNMVTGEVLPDRKFVVYTFNGKDGDPYGRGLGLMLWWHALFKRQNQEAWLIYNDKYASPTPYGTYPADASPDDKDALFAAIMSFSNSSGVISAEGTEIQLIESARAAGGDTFKVMRDAQNEDIQAIVLGSTYAAHAGALDGGSGANADQDDRLELAQSDANDLAMVLNRTWVKWTVEFNLPGARPPTLKWLVDAEEDLNKSAERDGKIFEMGFEPDPDYINTKYGGIWTKKAEIAPVISDVANFSQRLRGERRSDNAPAARRPGGVLQWLRSIAFSQAAATAPTDEIATALTDQLAAIADPIASNWVEEFRKIIETSTSLEEARDRLIDLYPKMDGRHFAETMSLALQVADLAGRLDMQHGG